MDKERIDLEIRLGALEHVLMQVAKVAFIALDPRHPETGQLAAQRLRESVRGANLIRTFPGLPPEFSDHAAAEHEAEVDRLLAGIEKLLA